MAPSWQVYSFYSTQSLLSRGGDGGDLVAKMLVMVILLIILLFFYGGIVIIVDVVDDDDSKMMMLLGELFMAPSPNLLHSLVLGFSRRLTQDSIKFEFTMTMMRMVTIMW